MSLGYPTSVKRIPILLKHLMQTQLQRHKALSQELLAQFFSGIAFFLRLPFEFDNTYIIYNRFFRFYLIVLIIS